MEEPKSDAKSIQQRVNAILSSYHERNKVFAAAVTAEEVEELEYLLARAEVELRGAQRKVDALREQLGDRRSRTTGIDAPD